MGRGGRRALLPHRLGSNGRCDATLAEGRDWLDAFAFSDVPNRGQTTHTVTRLTPCLRYAFIAASLNRRFGDARWSEWTFLTPAGDGNVSCPAATPTGTPAPTATPTPWPPPTGTGDYDADQDGLIEVSNLAQLNAIGADLDGDGLSPSRFYTSAFPGAQAGMGCPYVCARYELVADLNFDTNGNGAADAGDVYWNGGAGWFPIGDEANPYTAAFEGNGHTIANLYIDRRDSDYVGLFGYAGDGSSINRVGLVSVTVSGKHSVGSLVGYGYGSAITASYATGSVIGRLPGRRPGWGQRSLQHSNSQLRNRQCIRQQTSWRPCRLERI